ncbi:hypothetical protein ONZ45_g7026 [Pleurotus djamor]|nr:hypothetical protein ONZ45_g7026 [Pleurotus djamor]
MTDSNHPTQARSHFDDPAHDLARLIAKVALDPSRARAFGDAFYAIANAVEHKPRPISSSSNEPLTEGTSFSHALIPTTSSTPAAVCDRPLLELSTPPPSTSPLPFPTVEPLSVVVIERDDEDEEILATGSEHSFLRGLAFHIEPPP